MTPSTRDPSILASGHRAAGGESKRIKSNRFERTPTRDLIFSELSNSEGFKVGEPQVISFKFLNSVSRINVLIFSSVDGCSRSTKSCTSFDRMAAISE